MQSIAKPRYSTHTPRLLAKPCILVHLQTSTRYTIQNIANRAMHVAVIVNTLCWCACIDDSTKNTSTGKQSSMKRMLAASLPPKEYSKVAIPANESSLIMIPCLFGCMQVQCMRRVAIDQLRLLFRFKQDVMSHCVWPCRGV